MISALQNANLFLLAAPPSGSGGGGSSMTQTFIFMGLIFAVFWFFMIRPQRQKQKKRESMLKALDKGDKIVTIGGIRGTVTKAGETTVTIKVDDNCKIEFSRSAVSEVLLDDQEVARRAEQTKDDKQKDDKKLVDNDSSTAEAEEKSKDRGEEGAL